MTTVRETLAGAARVLRSHGIDTARLDAEVLLSFVLGISRTELYVRNREPLSDNKLEAFLGLLERRSRREPVAYITGEKEFMSLPFLVNPDVLIPRPETELLVEWIIEKNRVSGSGLKAGELAEEQAGSSPVIIDVGTGSGVIAASIARFLPRATVWALDISAAALKIALQNTIRLGVAERVNFINSDLLHNIPDELYGRVNWIIANLPYIPSAEIARLQPEIFKYEPYSALDGGGDGLDIYRELVIQAHEVLAAEGWLCLEMGPDQTRGLMSLLPESQWGEGAQVLKDYAGLDRFVVIRKKT